MGECRGYESSGVINILDVCINDVIKCLFVFPNVFFGIVLPSITNVSDSEFVLYTHPSFGSPVLSAFLAAIRAGWLRWPLSPVSLLKLSSKILPSRSPRP
jgi:hypothetical protein